MQSSDGLLANWRVCSLTLDKVMLHLFAILLGLLACSTATAQSITTSHEVLRRGDVLVVTASGLSSDNTLTCKIYFEGMSAGCSGEFPITERFIDPARALTPVSIVMWDHSRIECCRQPPVGSEAIVASRYLYIVNDLPQPAPGLIDVSKTDLNSGELFTVQAADILPPDTPFALLLYQLPGQTASGQPVLPRRLRFDIKEELDDRNHHFVAAAPIYPGTYEIRARVQGDYVIDAVQITVELSLPELTFKAEDSYVISPDEGFEIEPVVNPGTGTHTAANSRTWYGAELQLQREEFDGHWVPAGGVSGSITERSEFWSGELTGTVKVFPKAAGRHRLIAFGSHNRNNQRFEIGAVEFDVTILADPVQQFPRMNFSPPVPYNRSNIYRVGSPVALAFNAGFGTYNRVDVELRQRDFGNRGNLQVSRSYQPETEPIATWVAAADGQIEFPTNLPAGDYEVLVRGMTDTAPGARPSYISLERFTLVPPKEDFNVTVNNGRDVPLGPGFTVTLDLPELFRDGDNWLAVEIWKVSGDYLGVTGEMGKRVWTAPVDGGATSVFVGSEATRASDIFDVGLFEARIVLGSPRSGSKAVLAATRFTLGALPQPGALQPVSATTAEPLIVSMALPDAFQNVALATLGGWTDLSVQLWRKGDVLPTGVARPAVMVGEESVHDPARIDLGKQAAGVYELRLVQTPSCLFDLCPHLLLDRLDVEVTYALWRGPSVVETGGDDLEDLTRGPFFFDFSPLDEDERAPEGHPNYTPPPYLGLEVASFPREPRPGDVLAIGARVQNTSGHTAAGVVVDLTVADPGTEKAPDALVSLSSLCTDIGGGTYRCALGDMRPGDIADIELSALVPPAGFLIWTAEMSSAGDLGGETEAGGMLGQLAPPNIVEVVVLHDQAAIEDQVPLHPYPFGPNSRGTQSRYLLVVGQNLPQHPRAGLTLESSETIHNGFLSFPDTENPFYRHWIDTGWARFYDMADAAAARRRAEEDGYHAILVRADLKEGILPGRKTLVLSDGRGESAESNWDLEFGDIEAQISFVRLTNDGGFDLVSEAYLPERLHIAIEINMPLPMDTISVMLDAGDGASAMIPMTATRSNLFEGRVYLTGPIDLHATGRPASLTGGQSVSVTPDSIAPPAIEAHIDPSFMLRTFRVPVAPLVASTSVQISPAAGDISWLWKDALPRAASCHEDIEIVDWASLTLAESEDIWNLMIFDNSDHFPNQKVLFGHHAAAILLRDLFVTEMRARARTLEWARGNDRAITAMIAGLKPVSSREDIALLRMEVNGFSGGALDYRYVIMNGTDWLSEEHGTTEAAIEAWQARETKAAIDAMLEAMSATLDQATEAGDCDVEELIRLTGFGFEAVGERLKSRLMSLSEVTQPNGSRHQLWTPDYSGRFWVDQVAPLAAAVKAQQRAAQTDTDMALAVAAIVSLPLGLVGSTTIETLILIFEAIDLGYSAYDAYSQVAASDEEIEFASGATVVIGNDRYQDAIDDATTWISVGLSVVNSAQSVASSAYALGPRLMRLRQAARGRLVAQSLETSSDILRLRVADLKDFQAFAVGAYAKSRVSGPDTLTPMERRAVVFVDEIKAANPPPRRVSEPTADIRTMAPGLRPAEPIRFDVGEVDTVVSGAARVRPPTSGRIEDPVIGGDVPNARQARVPDNVSVRFTQEETGIEIEIPLGERLGEGATSEVFAHPDFPDTRAVRITYVDKNAAVASLDRFGERVLREVISSEHIRPVTLYRDYAIAGGEFGGRRIARVTEVERLEGIAWDHARRMQGELTIAQIMAFDGALNELNSKGFVWMDNKGNNYDFVPLGDGSGRVQVVVMDSGGIYQVRPGAGEAFGITDAELARRVQLRINGDFATQHPDYAWVGTPKFRTALRRDLIGQDFREVFDYDGMDLPSGFLHFTPASGESYPEISPIFEAVD